MPVPPDSFTEEEMPDQVDDAKDWCPSCGAHWPGRVSDYDLDKREELVQEVIRLTRVYEAAATHGTKAALDKAVFDLLSANLKLAEFRP